METSDVKIKLAPFESLLNSDNNDSNSSFLLSMVNSIALKASKFIKQESEESERMTMMMSDEEEEDLGSDGGGVGCRDSLGQISGGEESSGGDSNIQNTTLNLVQNNKKTKNSRKRNRSQVCFSLKKAKF
jgi:hypothetical protein